MGVITGRGINQADLAYLLQLIATNFAGVTAKLDAESLGDSDYASTLDFTLPSTISGAGIKNQGVLLDYLKDVRTAFNALNAKLDADGTVNSTTYASTCDIASLIDNLALGSLEQAGVYEGALVKWLDTYITDWNACLALLDADTGVSGTNYVSLWGISTLLIDSTGCVNKP